MNLPSPVLEALARRYERSQAGRTGEANRDVLVKLEDLLREANCAEGDARALAEQHLREAAGLGIISLDPIHKRDRSSIHQVRITPSVENEFYKMIGRPSPREDRRALADQFTRASTHSVPEQWKRNWVEWCEQMAAAALEGASTEPFTRKARDQNADLLLLLARLLAWEGESLVRFASCILTKDSKTLESLAALEREGEFQGKLRGKLGRVLEQITQGAIRSLDDLGILPNPRFALVHGPLKLQFEGEWLNLGLLHGAFRLARSDIDRASSITTTARRCLTIENETLFHELAKLQSGELLVQTSFPGAGTLALLSRLPDDLEFWHFGDSDSAGFEILRVLREYSGRDFQPLHMQPGKVPFEQESLGRPSKRSWPFYETKRSEP